jgi:hypothetical protein
MDDYDQWLEIDERRRQAEAAHPATTPASRYRAVIDAVHPERVQRRDLQAQKKTT